LYDEVDEADDHVDDLEVDDDVVAFVDDVSCFVEMMLVKTLVRDVMISVGRLVASDADETIADGRLVSIADETISEGRDVASDVSTVVGNEGRPVGITLVNTSDDTI